MSVIVKGMEMPKNCKSCPLRYSSTGYAWCDITGASLALEIDMRDYTCPLIELPPHGRLIDVETIEEIRFHDADGYHVVNGEQLCELEIEAKTVIEAEGSEE